MQITHCTPHKSTWGIGVTAPRILKFGIRRLRMVSFRHLPLYHRTKRLNWLCLGFLDPQEFVICKNSACYWYLSLNAVVAQLKKCHLELVPRLSSNIQELHRIIPAHYVVETHPAICHIVGCSCHIFELNHSINNKWAVFGLCLYWIVPLLHSVSDM